MRRRERRERREGERERREKRGTVILPAMNHELINSPGTSRGRREASTFLQECQ